MRRGDVMGNMGEIPRQKDVNGPGNKRSGSKRVYGISETGLEALLCFRHNGFKGIRVLHHRAIEENRLREIVAPACSRSISGRQIP